MRLYTVSLLILGLSACGGSSEPSSSSSEPAVGPTASSSASTAAQGAQDGEILVQVGDVVITTEEFQAAAARKLPPKSIGVFIASHSLCSASFLIKMRAPMMP